MIVLDILLIPHLSFNGAAIANLVTYTIATAYFIIASLIRTGVRAKDYFSIRRSDLKSFSVRFYSRKNENT
jgi:O-antigen/teichoic acid export membrane protein